MAAVAQNLLLAGGCGSAELSLAFRLPQHFCSVILLSFLFSLPSLDFLQRWVLNFVLCKEYKYKVVP